MHTDAWAAPTLHWLAGSPDKATQALLQQPGPALASRPGSTQPSTGSSEPSVLQTLYLISHTVPAALPPTPAVKVKLAEVAAQASRQLEVAGLPLLALEALHLELLLDPTQAGPATGASDSFPLPTPKQSLTHFRAARLAALSALGTIVHSHPGRSSPAPLAEAALPAARAHFAQLLSCGLQFEAAVATEGLEHMLQALHPPPMHMHQADDWQAEGGDELSPLGASPVGASPLLSHHSFGTGRVQSRRTSEGSSGMGLSVRRSVSPTSLLAVSHWSC